MAKGQMRGNREVRKPKATKTVTVDPATASFLAKAKPGTTGLPKKKA